MTDEPLAAARRPAESGLAGRSARRQRDRLQPPPTTSPHATSPLDDLLGPVASSAAIDAACWERGAAGEEVTARLLAPLADLGWTVLHDRRVPGSPANIDHLAIGGKGIFLIDTKAWRGELKLLGDGRFWYGPVALDDILAQTRWQADEVELRLQRRLHEPVDVQPVLCLHGPRLPSDSLRLCDVVVVAGPSLVKLLLETAVAGELLDPVRVGMAAPEIFPVR